jgi:hypothetical protein
MCNIVQERETHGWWVQSACGTVGDAGACLPDYTDSSYDLWRRIFLSTECGMGFPQLHG